MHIHTTDLIRGLISYNISTNAKKQNNHKSGFLPLSKAKK